MSKLSDNTDEKLMQRYAEDSDQAAFNLLYARNKGALYRYLYRQTSDRGVADELFQEIWINLIKARQRYKVQAKFSTYLFHIAHNRLIDFYRRKSLPISYTDAQDPDLLESNGVEQPDRQVEIHNNMQRLEDLLEKLPEAQRETFILKEESGMTLDEIAEILRVNKETVKSRLRYALKKLRAGMLRNNGDQ